MKDRADQANRRALEALEDAQAAVGNGDPSAYGQAINDVISALVEMPRPGTA